MAIKPRRRAVHFVLRAGTRWPGGICVRTGPSARTRVDQRRERDTSHGACGLSCLPQETEEGWRAARVDGRLGFRTRGKCCTSTYVPRMPASSCWSCGRVRSSAHEGNWVMAKACEGLGRFGGVAVRTAEASHRRCPCREGRPAA